MELICYCFYHDVVVLHICKGVVRFCYLCCCGSVLLSLLVWAHLGAWWRLVFLFALSESI